MYRIFLCSVITIAVFQIFEIIWYYIHFSNNLFIALMKLSFHKYFDILGCISMDLILLRTFNLDTDSFMSMYCL